MFELLRIVSADPQFAFEFPEYPVREDEGPVEVCVLANVELAQSLSFGVEAAVNPSSLNPASGRHACEFSILETELVLRLFCFNHFCLQMMILLLPFTP